MSRQTDAEERGMMPLAAPMSGDLETAKPLLALARRYLDREAAKAAQAIGQAEAIVTEAAKQQAQGKPQS
jgi:hypothetical protein